MKTKALKEFLFAFICVGVITFIVYMGLAGTAVALFGAPPTVMNVTFALGNATGNGLFQGLYYASRV